MTSRPSRAASKCPYHSESVSGTISAIPRWTTGSGLALGMGPSPPGARGSGVVGLPVNGRPGRRRIVWKSKSDPTEDEGAAGGGGGPAHVHGDASVADLPAAARAVLVRVEALGGARAVVVDGSA